MSAPVDVPSLAACTRSRTYVRAVDRSCVSVGMCVAHALPAVAASLEHCRTVGWHKPNQTKQRRKQPPNVVAPPIGTYVVLTCAAVHLPRYAHCASCYSQNGRACDALRTTAAVSIRVSTNAKRTAAFAIHLLRLTCKPHSAGQCAGAAAHSGRGGAAAFGAHDALLV